MNNQCCCDLMVGKNVYFSSSVELGKSSFELKKNLDLLQRFLSINANPNFNPSLTLTPLFYIEVMLGPLNYKCK